MSPSLTWSVRVRLASVVDHDGEIGEYEIGEYRRGRVRIRNITSSPPRSPPRADYRSMGRWGRIRAWASLIRCTSVHCRMCAATLRSGRSGAVVRRVVRDRDADTLDA